MIPEFLRNTPPANESQDIILNDSFPNRYKDQIKKLEKVYIKNKDSKYFFDELVNICLLINDVARETIFYNATKFMLNRDSETTVKLYIYYLNGVLNNHKLVTEKKLYSLIVNHNRVEFIKPIKKEYSVLLLIYELNIKIIETLKNEVQIQFFKDILIKFISNKDINEALNKVPNISRKKIRIDNNQVVKIQQQHSESVSLLNEYLKDESENNTFDSTALKSGKVAPTVEIRSKSLSGAGGIVFSNIQLSALSIFAKNNLRVLQSDMDTFARSRGILKNQLIESLNELCYDRLDDVLIEEKENFYIINSDYYQTVFAK
jgi:hypothetical protein